MYIGSKLRIQKLWRPDGAPEGGPTGGEAPAGSETAGAETTGEPAGEPGGEVPGDTGETGDPEPTYEELKAAADEAATKAEDLRRSKLTDAERQAEDDAKAADAVPEEYADFTMPEGMPADEAVLNDFKPVAKELGLSQSKAQRLIDLYSDKVLPAMMQRQTDTWQQTLDGWVKDAKADKEIGGDKFDAAVSDAQRVVNTLGTPELKQVFDQYGLGNNPELVRVFSRMAKYLKEDSMETGNPSEQSKRSIESRLYPGLA